MIHHDIFRKFYNLAEDEYVQCALCQRQAVDIHHIDIKGMGGSQGKEHITNYIPLCRTCHTNAHAGLFCKDFLKAKVESLIERQVMNERFLKR